MERHACLAESLLQSLEYLSARARRGVVPRDLGNNLASFRVDHRVVVATALDTPLGASGSQEVTLGTVRWKFEMLDPASLLEEVQIMGFLQ
jgi:hypothetical protein